MTFCLTQALYLPFNKSIYLCTASTDGHICFWSLSALLAENGISTRTPEPRIVNSSSSNNEIFPSSSPYTTNLSWQSRTKIHQSSIKAMCSFLLSPSTIIIVTGGDDGALGFTRVTYSPNNTSFPHDSQQPLSCSVLLIPNAHAAAITAITYLGPPGPSLTGIFHSKNKTRRENDPQTQQHSFFFATTGPDQKLQLWHVSFDLARPGVEGLRVQKGDWVNTAVADLACLEVLSSDWEGEESYEDDDGVDDNDAKKNENEATEPYQTHAAVAAAAAEPLIQRPSSKPSETQSISESKSNEDETNSSIIHQAPLPTSPLKIKDSNQQQQQHQRQKQLRILVAGIGLEVRNLAALWESTITTFAES